MEQEKEIKNKEEMNEQENENINNENGTVADEQTGQNNEEDSMNETTTDEETKEEMDSKVEELQKELDDTKNRLLRVQADYENFRRRTRKEREADAKYRSQSLVEDILPVLDNFERALSMKPESEEGKNFLQGMEMVYKQLLDALNKEGVSVIEAVGKPFDPHLHQAIMQVQVEDEEKDIVVEEVQKGYMLKDRVIRPSMVKVNS